MAILGFGAGPHPPPERGRGQNRPLRNTITSDGFVPESQSERALAAMVLSVVPCARPGQRSRSSRRLLQFQPFQCLEQVLHIRRVKHAVRPMHVDVGEGRGIQPLCRHGAVLGQVLHDLVEELQLAGAGGAAGDQVGKGLRGGFAVQTDERADEDRQAGVQIACARNVAVGAAGFVQQCFKLLQIGGGQRLVAAQLVQRQPVGQSVIAKK